MSNFDAFNPPLDEEKFKPLFGIFVSGEVLFTPYTDPERKLLAMMRANSDALPKDEINYLRFNHYIFPFLIAAGFGSLGAFLFWKLDQTIEKAKGGADIKSSYEENTSKGAETAKSSVKETKEDPLKDIKLSRKRLKGNEEVQKYDYYKAVQNLSKDAKEEAPVNVFRKLQGWKRYGTVFSCFFFIGVFQGAIRSRINLYWRSKQHRDILKNTSEEEEAKLSQYRVGVKTQPQVNASQEKKD